MGVRRTTGRAPTVVVVQSPSSLIFLVILGDLGCLLRAVLGPPPRPPRHGALGRPVHRGHARARAPRPAAPHRPLRAGPSLVRRAPGPRRAAAGARQARRGQRARADRRHRAHRRRLGCRCPRGCFGPFRRSRGTLDLDSDLAPPGAAPHPCSGRPSPGPAEPPGARAAAARRAGGLLVIVPLVALSLLPVWALAPAVLAVVWAFLFVRSGVRAERRVTVRVQARRRRPTSPGVARPLRRQAAAAARPARRARHPRTAAAAAVEGDESRRGGRALARARRRGRARADGRRPGGRRGRRGGRRSPTT